MTTPSPTVIEEARKMAAAYIATIYGETYREETLDGTRWLRLSEAFIAAIELGERRGRQQERDCRETSQAASDAADAIERGDHRSKPA